MSHDDAIRTLREALKLSPENLPLRQHLADMLLSAGQPQEAEEEYRRALAMAPSDVALQLGLATAFSQQGKDSHALVILEEMLKQKNAPPRAWLLHARLLFRSGEVPQAVTSYRQAIDRDPSLIDREFAARLGIGASQATGEVVEGKVRASWEGAPDAPPEATVERPKITFDDVGGMETLKEEIRLKIIHPLTHPELYKTYGKPIGGGILMYGPPGCGKTHLARATAGEIEAGFIAVGINDVLEMWIGNSERNLHELFEQARRNRPCVLFFDEVDALGASRSDMRHSAGRQLINQFLAELDGVQSSNEGVLILAATNAPWHVDPAFRRPGRFDRILFVPPPDAAARDAILRILVRGKPIGEIDYAQVAKKADAFSGADLKAVVDVAIEHKLKDAMATGTPKPLTTKDLLSGAAGVKPSTKEWFSTARNYALYANQGGLYDDILKYLKA
ncbi:MAG: cell division protein [Candidatus Omnitrophica bacterium CG11_big_fil_rev_8_21_14_0_20_63_9]|nr:MAG: cell division protein [Candidatus Omnitrophica bacterium CG11_big_fil_rev_8_21_14_0_20_63_9]